MMPKRNFALLGAYLSTVIIVAENLSTAIAQAITPNVILVMTDDQGYGPLGRHGNTWIKTPNLDNLYDHSVRFDRFLVSPTCSPTRSAIMTGRHPEKNGITHTILERERMTLDAVTLPEILQQAGYNTGIFGKWHLGDEDEYQPNQRGFSEGFIHGAGGIGQAYDCSCADVPNNSYFNPIVRHNGVFKSTEGFCTDVFFDTAIHWIDNQVKLNKPYFAYISTNAPHSPYYAPEKNIDRFKKLGFADKPAGFYGMIENIDENIGELIEYLQEKDQLANTVVIFMSDNGTAHEGITKKPLGTNESGDEITGWNAEMKGLKNTPDEGGVRVPFFIRWDGHLQPGKSITTLAAHIDIMPTLAELCKATLPRNGQVEGRSMLSLLPWTTQAPKFEKIEWSDRYLFTHICRWPTGANVDEFRTKGYAVRNQKYRLVNGELYDMEEDPGQTLNLRDALPQVAEEMESAFDKYWEEAKPLMVNELAKMSPTKPYWVAFEKQKATTGIPKWTKD